MGYTKLNVKNNVLKQGVHYMTSDYKSRNKSRPTHNGIDMIGNYYACDYIVAIDDGKVAECSKDAERGNYVSIRHENGYYSNYYHMKDGSVVVKKGQQMTKGDKIGYMGSTGRSTGNHLHFGVSTGNGWLDPMPYLTGEKSFRKEEPTPAPTPTPTKSIDEVAEAVIRGEYGNYPERKEKLEAEGYNYSEVQNRVNEMLKGEDKPKTYTVKKGDTLSEIAVKFGTTVDKLIELNAEKYPRIETSDGNYIQTGWTLIIG